MSDFLFINMKRKFEKYYKNNVKEQIYHWSNKTLVEWYKCSEKNRNQLFDILEELCRNIYEIGYQDGYDDQ